MAKITILGSGGFGTALAVAAYSSGNEVTLWSAFEEELEGIRKDGENKRLLPGVDVPGEITLSSDITRAANSDMVIFAVPSFAVREVAQKAAPYIKGGIVLVNVAKGFEQQSLKRLSTVIAEEIPGRTIVILSGPGHAEEIATGVPTTLVAASIDKPSALYVQKTLSGDTLRIYGNPDVAGVEIGGALKNVIALCAGICDGYRLGDNTKAALMTRGIAEIERLGVAMGGNGKTFAGLTGIGDLIVTCMSGHSRNRRAGILIGEGISPEDAVKKVGTVEGYKAALIAHELAGRHGVSMPITEQLYGILYKGTAVPNALQNLMSRSQKDETIDSWI
ncbi:MAG: NAD(P)-dependent glycerol-3-phosphate dehydrogenase [Oscillospiraceae bacterium]|nr:NAD(P)-dependent glycerol-3-phosphate dehydrogenase [Oscillospiraceae bacterium]